MQRHECFAWIWYHLRLIHCKTANKVEKVLQHFLAELTVGGWRRLKTENVKCVCGCGCVRVWDKWAKYFILTVAGTSCVICASGSMDTPICAVCEIGCAPNTLNCDITADRPFVSISSSFFNVDILKIADGFEFEM